VSADLVSRGIVYEGRAHADLIPGALGLGNHGQRQDQNSNEQLLHLHLPYGRAIVDREVGNDCRRCQGRIGI
jgi:hypothetical protein